MKLIPYGKQYIDREDLKFVTNALKRDKITTGEIVKEFENKITNFLKCRYSVTCNSGTSALFIALQSIEIKKDDILIMPSINFISSYNVAKILGAKIFLADVNRFTGQMSPKDVIDCCKKFKLKKIKAIITMYNGGYPNEIENFFKLKKKLKCFIIEDACHALGASYKANGRIQMVGSCKHSDISTFSLHPLKTITTGEGGIVTTNNKKIRDKLEVFRSLGIQRSRKKHWKYDVLKNGMNFRLTDFQCALGISQLKKIKKFISKRKKIFNYYSDKLKNNNFFSVPQNFKGSYPSYHLYLINLKTKNLKLKENLITYMLKNKIMLQQHYIPIFNFKTFKEKFLGNEAKKYHDTTISIPIYFELTFKQQDLIINKLNNFFKK